ncbi:MAG: threonine/serine exporter family protein [Armatimonadetes bacterium]|nr:threonine/serine exporter family protein [Armatimonadota bacterium]
MSQITAASRPTRRKIGDTAFLCLELGAGLLENGAETSRVEESIALVGSSLGLATQSMVTPTGITVSAGAAEPITRIARIRERKVDLGKVSRLNSLSRRLVAGELEIEAAREQIESIRRAPAAFNPAQHRLSTAVAAACFALLAGGREAEAVFAFFAGGMVGLLIERLAPRFPPFLRLFFAALLVTSACGVLVRLFGLAGSKVVIGALMPQMPGLALVAAARDLMAGELIAGVARGAEAVLVALAMASGVMVGLSLSHRWFPGVPGVIGL